MCFINGRQKNSCVGMIQSKLDDTTIEAPASFRSTRHSVRNRNYFKINSVYRSLRFDSGRAFGFGRDAVPLGKGGGVFETERRSDPLESSPLTLGVGVLLRLRLRDVPALTLRPRPPLAPPLPRLFLVAPFELKPLPRLATGADGAAPSSDDSEDGSGDSSRVLCAANSLLRCSRKSSTTCCRRLLA